MDPTSLPTDNLWKFMALAGLALAGFCAWLSWKMRETHYGSAAQLRERYTVRLAKVEAFGRTADRLSNDNDELRTELDTAAAANPDPDALVPAGLAKRVATTNNRVQELQQEQDQLRLELAANEGELTSLETRWSRYQEALTALSIGISVGLCASVIGFAGWYRNVQWYTDRQAKADFEDHMQELAAKRVAREKAVRDAKP